VTDRRIYRRRKHWAVILGAAAGAVVVGYRLSGRPIAWVLVSAGVLLAAWCLIFHRDKARMIRLNLLLNQRVGVLFSDPTDADGFLRALEEAKGGKFPVIRR